MYSLLERLDALVECEYKGICPAVFYAAIENRLVYRQGSQIKCVPGAMYVRYCPSTVKQYGLEKDSRNLKLLQIDLFKKESDRLINLEKFTDEVNAPQNDEDDVYLARPSEKIFEEISDVKCHVLAVLVKIKYDDQSNRHYFAQYDKNGKYI